MEEQEKPKKIKLPVIPMDALVEIKMSGFFINKLQNLIIAISHEVGEKNLIEFYENIKNNKQPKTVEEMSLGLLTALIQAAEESAEKNKQMKEMEFEPDQLTQYFENKKII